MAQTTKDIYSQIYDILTKREGFRKAFQEDNDIFWVIVDIKELWEFMSKEDQIVIFGASVENLVGRYLTNLIDAYADPSCEEVWLWSYHAHEAKETFAETGHARLGVDKLIALWRKQADRVIYPVR